MEKNLRCKSCGKPLITHENFENYTSELCEDCRKSKNNGSVKDNKINVLKEISTQWKIDAKQESTDYFYCTNEANRLLAGERFFVIGRKGTGKTAIAEFISKNHNEKHFSEKLSFKNFPFNYLYSLENTKYTAPNQYITIWKYLIYSSVCRMMSRNISIESDLVQKLKKMYPDNSKAPLNKLVETWTAKSFGVDILGFGVEGERETRRPEELTWIEKSDILEKVIIDYIDNSNYYILIDELDEDYREFDSNEERETYFRLLTSLFKAVQDIRALFKNNGGNIFPIIFLRTDIYSLLKDSDKNKWREYKIDMDWGEKELQAMLAHRISVALGVEKLEFNEAWNHLFEPGEVEMGFRQRKRMNKFNYITRSTQLRPRDYIHYIVECANAALLRGKSRISSEIIKAVDDLFSDYLRDEIIDEVYSVIPEINEVFEILSQIRKQTFPPHEFVENYNSYVASGRIPDKGAENILRLLFEFSVIGNDTNIQTKTIFKYQNVRARFNYKETIRIHRGLYKALQIY